MSSSSPRSPEGRGCAGIALVAAVRLHQALPWRPVPLHDLGPRRSIHRGSAQRSRQPVAAGGMPICGLRRIAFFFVLNTNFNEHDFKRFSCCMSATPR